jgi:S-adenosylmethionine:tRNA ribosyltransferase-isomerase
LMDRYGTVPLPPYVTRTADAEDELRYQTVYAEQAGSVAAPTAGLHFTPQILEQIRRTGARVEDIVLHVGPGTFKPVQVEDPAHHVMHAEWFAVPPDTASAITEAHGAGKRVWAVGTTVTRVLETVGRGRGREGPVRPQEGWTDLFIRPPYEFRIVGGMLTNFHLPRSTLLMLVCAFGGYDNVMHAYREAVAQRYRLFSYGDAMVIG